MPVDVSSIPVSLANSVPEDTSSVPVNPVLGDMNSDPRDLNSAPDKSKDVEMEDSTLKQPTIFPYKR